MQRASVKSTPMCGPLFTIIISTLIVGGMLASFLPVQLGHANNQPPPSMPSQLSAKEMVTGGCPGPNPFQNPGFETGSLSAWGTADYTVIDPQHHSGTYSAYVAVSQNVFYADESSISQHIAVPQSGGTLSYWYIARLHNTGGGQTRVHQYAYLSYAGGSNYYIMDVMEDTNYNWRERTFDMTPYAGQAVTLTLGVNISIGDDGAGASLNLDDVTIHWQQPDFADVSPDINARVKLALPSFW